MLRGPRSLSPRGRHGASCGCAALLAGVVTAHAAAQPQPTAASCGPRPQDYKTTGISANVLAKIPALKQFAGEAAFSVKRDIARVREVLPPFYTVESLMYFLCEQQQRGVLTQAEYRQILWNALPMLPGYKPASPPPGGKLGGERADAAAFVRPLLARLEERTVADVRYLGQLAATLRSPDPKRRRTLLPKFPTTPSRLDADDLRRVCRRVGLAPALAIKDLTDMDGVIAASNLVYRLDVTRTGTVRYDPSDASAYEARGLWFKMTLQRADSTTWEAVRSGEWVETPPSVRDCDQAWDIARFSIPRQQSAREQAAIDSLVERYRRGGRLSM